MSEAAVGDSAAALLETVRARGKASIETALAMLDVYPLSETSEKHRLLDIASRGLPAKAVVGRFIELAAEEKDDELRDHLISMLFYVDIREIPDSGKWVALLTACLEHEVVRGRAARCLARIIVGNSAAQEALIAACRATTNRDHERQLLSALSTLEVLSPPVRALFLEMLSKVDADAKAGLLARLLAGGPLPLETLLPMLTATEPSSIKRIVLAELLDRAPGSADSQSGIPPALLTALLELLARDPDPGCRYAAIDVLAARAGRAPETAAALMTALQKDPNTDVREAAMLAFDHSLDRSEASLSALAQAIASERTRDGLTLLLRLVSPFAGRSPAVRNALLGLLRENLRAELAEQVVSKLGKLAARDAELAKLLLSTLQTEKDQRVRAALLEALLLQPDLNGELVPAYLAALESSDARLRTLGVKGLLRVPLQPSQCAQLGPAVLALKDKSIDRWSRRPLAEKLARLTNADAGHSLAASFKTVASQIEDDEVRKTCEAAADRAAASEAADGGAVDWNEWFQRVEVEHRTEGIFPELFVHFGENPEAAKRILRAALNPPASETLYQTYRGQLSPDAIVGALRDRNFVDDDISRYCLAQLMKSDNYGDGRFHLGVLKSNPKFPSLRDDLFRILETRKESPPVLMRELFEAAHGDSSQPILAELSQRLAAAKTEEQAGLYLRFLLGNACWPPAQKAFSELSPASPVLQSGEMKKKLEEIAKAMNVKVPSAPVAAVPAKQEEAKSDGPGFADE